MKTQFKYNALIINNGKVDPFNVLVHTIRREQKSVVVIEEFENQNVLGISSSDNIRRTIELLEESLSDLRGRLK